MDLLSAPIATAEFMVVDTETNGLAGDDCELTEVGAVLVGGGELHDRWSSLCRTSAPLRRGIQRLTGITQAMVDGAPSLEDVLPPLSELLQGRVLVAHNAPFDRRVLRQAFGRIGLEWPDPPVICTAAMARSMLPLQRRRGLGVLADALGIEVHTVHRALADAETCARVLCALFPRLCANAATVGDALAMLTPRRRPRKRPMRPWQPAGPGAGRAGARAAQVPRRRRSPTSRELPRDPGVYLFRDDAGRVLYVGKSVSIRSRARAHFAPSSPPAAWTRHATVVDYRTTGSELGALILENRLIKELKPPGNKRLTRRDDRLVYIRCRLDIPFPILEVAPDPAAGHAVTVGPVRGRRLALELVEQLDSLFGLRHCGRRLPRREYPSAYGQMGRCLSPCLGDLDPNLYRRRLDEVLALFVGEPARLRPAAAAPRLRPDAGRRGPAALRARRVAAAPRRAAAHDPRPPRRRARGHPRAAATRAGPASRAAARPRRSGWSAGGSSTSGALAGGEAERARISRRAPRPRCGARGGSARWAPTSRPTRSTRCGSSAPGWPRTRTRRSWCCARRRTVTRCGTCWRAPGPVRSGGEGELDDDGVDLVGADHHV